MVRGKNNMSVCLPDIRNNFITEKIVKTQAT